MITISNAVMVEGPVEHSFGALARIETWLPRFPWLEQVQVLSARGDCRVVVVIVNLAGRRQALRLFGVHRTDEALRYELLAPTPLIGLYTVEWRLQPSASGHRVQSRHCVLVNTHAGLALGAVQRRINRVDRAVLAQLGARAAAALA